MLELTPKTKDILGGGGIEPVAEELGGGGNISGRGGKGKFPRLGGGGGGDSPMLGRGGGGRELGLLFELPPGFPKFCYKSFFAFAKPAESPFISYLGFEGF